jgi:hypothetical protein
MRYVVAALFIGCAIFVTSGRASATPEYARQTLLSCSACHSVGVKLNDFGRAFVYNGDRLPWLLPKGDVPLQIRAQAVYTSDPDPTGLPKTIVDEVEILSSAQIGKNFGYGLESYVLDGGVPGDQREAWASYNTSGGLPASLRAGLQVLPLPLDPERFRDSNNHYLIWDQTVGINPFNFIDPMGGARVAFGRDGQGLSGSVLALYPHDQGSTVPGVGTDSMFTLKDASPAHALQVYYYAGQRDVGGIDAFSRTGYALGLYHGRAWFDATLQEGYDSNPNGDGVPIRSSGGFAQLRYQIGANGFALARYDGVSDTSGNFERTMTIGYGLRFLRGFKVEFEDVVSHQPQTHNTFSIVFGFGVSTYHVGDAAY